DFINSVALVLKFFDTAVAMLILDYVSLKSDRPSVLLRVQPEEKTLEPLSKGPSSLWARRQLSDVDRGPRLVQLQHAVVHRLKAARDDVQVSFQVPPGTANHALSLLRPTSFVDPTT